MRSVVSSRSWPEFRTSTVCIRTAACTRAWALGLPVYQHKMADSVLANSEREIGWIVVQRGDSLRSVSHHLQGRFPGVAGLSVRRFCSSCGIHYRSTLGEGELDEVVRSRVGSVGHSYGRRSLQGLLRAEGIRVSQR